MGSFLLGSYLLGRFLLRSYLLDSFPLDSFLLGSFLMCSFLLDRFLLDSIRLWLSQFRCFSRWLVSRRRLFIVISNAGLNRTTTSVSTNRYALFRTFFKGLQYFLAALYEMPCTCIMFRL